MIDTPTYIKKEARFLVIKAPGSNCDQESKFALEQAGAVADIVPIQALLSKEIILAEYDGIFIPGGFSYGDDLGSGRIFSSLLREILSEQLNSHIENGRQIIGICNGFQVLVELGILPDGEVVPLNLLQTALAHNITGNFMHEWIYMKPVESKSVLRLEDQGIMHLPIAHGEGRFVASPEKLQELKDKGLIVYQYSSEFGEVNAEDAASNPNGSMDAIAAITDETGLAFGAMPHFERHVRKAQDRNWRREKDQKEPDGARFFKRIVQRAKQG